MMAGLLDQVIGLLDDPRKRMALEEMLGAIPQKQQNVSRGIRQGIADSVAFPREYMNTYQPGSMAADNPAATEWAAGTALGMVGSPGTPVGALGSSMRSKVGGQIADANGYYYKGGQFLPSTEAPPGTWRVKVSGKATNVPNGQELVAPGEFAARPTPFSRSIYQVMGGGAYVDVGKDGVAKLNPNINWSYLGATPDDKSPVRFKKLAESKEHFSTNELVEMYNKGVRWIDTDPLPGVEIVAKGD
jgi:hypothetical protein